jgi:hypothetical protein
MYYIGLDVHKKTISYCVKDAAGRVHGEGKIGSTRCELDAWIRTLPQPRTIATRKVWKSDLSMHGIPTPCRRPSGQMSGLPIIHSKCPTETGRGRLAVLPVNVKPVVKSDFA